MVTSRGGLHECSLYTVAWFSVLKTFTLKAKFHYSIQLSGSRASSTAGRRPGFRPVADRFELSRHIEIAPSGSQTGSQTSLRAGQRNGNQIIANIFSNDNDMHEVSSRHISRSVANSHRNGAQFHSVWRRSS